MNLIEGIKRFWSFLKQDTWQAWVVSLVLIIILIKFVLFPLMSLITGSPLPLVVVESCSMYHGMTKDYQSAIQNGQLVYISTGKYRLCDKTFDQYKTVNSSEYWNACGSWYKSRNISEQEFNNFKFSKGLSKGDIILLWGHSQYKKGDTIIFVSTTAHPIIHRLISNNPYATKGDHNQDQLPGGLENGINKQYILGKGALRIPFVGWVKLIFFEHSRATPDKGLC